MGILATVGMFDGVHSGHRFLIDYICREASKLNLSTKVITFTNHPLSVVRPADAPKLISNPVEKSQLIKNLGIDTVELLDFTPQLRNLSARQFIEMLRDQYGVTHLAMGFNNSFGNNRTLTFDDFKKIGDEIGVTIIQLPEYTEHGQKVSSSAIRKLISKGEVAEASSLLGRNISLTGKVVHGRNIGHTIGFPTANIQPLFDQQIIPANGVYAASITIAGKKYRSMVNIGLRPTFESVTPQMSIEAYIDGFEKDIYGSTVTLNFIKRLRDEIKFDNIDQLKQQLTRDLKQLRQLK